MNHLFVINRLGVLLVMLSALMLAASAWAVLDYWVTREDPAGSAALLISGAAGLLFGGGLWLAGMRARVELFGRREAMLLVGLGWLLGAALAGLPYLIWALFDPAVPADHPFRNFIDCYFESMSGLTTTGSTVLSEISAVPNSLLLWRSLTQWFGGLGIIVLFVAVLPSLGVSGKRLFVAEVSGPAPTGVRPRIRDTARALWIIYLGLSAVQVLALRICGMNWFDSICHTLTTMPTGGFSPRDASVGEFDSTAINLVIIVFMFLGGISFGLYYQMLRGSWRKALHDTELKFYVALLAGATLLIALTLMFAGGPIVTSDGRELAPSLAAALEHSAFNLVSVQTTTGYATADTDQWPFFAKAGLVVAMFIGGSAGSTASGLKVVRVWIAIKVIFTELEHVFHPSVVRPVKYGARSISQDLKLAVLAYLLGMGLLFGAGSVAIMLFDGGDPRCDYVTAASASIATLFNIGPGFGAVGAVENFGWMTSASKFVMSLLMVLGRLELFAVLVLFLPSFWRGE